MTGKNYSAWLDAKGSLPVFPHVKVEILYQPMTEPEIMNAGKVFWDRVWVWRKSK